VNNISEKGCRTGVPFLRVGSVGQNGSGISNGLVEAPCRIEAKNAGAGNSNKDDKAMYSQQPIAPTICITCFKCFFVISGLTIALLAMSFAIQLFQLV